MSTIYYFTYGYNANIDSFLKDFSTAHGKVVLQDHILDFATQATITESVGNSVEGLVHEMDAALLLELDGFEGYPMYFDRKLVDIDLNGTPIQAYVYYTNDVNFERKPPSSSYLTVIHGSYDRAGLSWQQLQYAVFRSGPIWILR